MEGIFMNVERMRVTGLGDGVGVEYTGVIR